MCNHQRNRDITCRNDAWTLGKGYHRMGKAAPVVETTERGAAATINNSSKPSYGERVAFLMVVVMPT